MEANSTEENHHAIVLPLPFQGHVNPTVHLSLKLASRGFTITFLVFESIHHDITKARNATRPGTTTESGDMFEGARTGPNPLDIRYQVVPDGLPVNFDRWGGLEESLESWLNGVLYAKLEEVVGEIMSEQSQPRPNVFVADTFFPWASKIATKFGLFHASFWTQPALAFNLYYHVHLLREHGHIHCADPRKDPIDYIPGVKSIDPKDLVSNIHDKDTSNFHKVISAAFEDVRSANCVLCNTIQDLEATTISALQVLMPFYPIGPIIQPGSTTKCIGPTSLWAEVSCSEWLGRKPKGSVLYVSFGSFVGVTKDDIVEVAHGLKLSNVDFVWVLRLHNMLRDNESPLPQGFAEEVAGRGIVVPWTSQTAILSHHAIGGFLTHCGWNSVLESIWYQVPLLCFPIFSDQLTNRKLVVDDWKIGINLCHNGPIRRDQIAAQIQNFMSPNLRDELGQNMQATWKTLKNALGAGGYSEKNMDLFIQKLNK